MADEARYRNAAYSWSCSSCCAFILLLIALLSPWTIWGWYSDGFNYGMGPWYAGVVTQGSVVRSNVQWWQIDGANACQNGTDIYIQWSQPMGMCSDTNQFITPVTAFAIQGVTTAAVVFSFLSCTLGCASGRYGHGVIGLVGGVSAIVAFACTVSAIALWCTWNLAQRYFGPGGFVVPVFDAGILLPSPAVSMWYGWTFWLLVSSAVLLFFPSIMSIVGYVLMTPRGRGYQAMDKDNGALSTRDA